MNFNKFLNSSYLKENPLCGINTYKDELNLATGACTRNIKKIVLTGEENWWVYTGKVSTFAIATAMSRDNAGICSHYTPVIATEFDVNTGFYVRNSALLIISDTRFTDRSDFKTYLAQQYANGTPVVVYYILSTATTETVTVPTGLSGTEVGYLNRSGTPTPTNPIYPTANTVEKWFDINHYIMGTSTDTITTLPADIYANDNNATVGLQGNMSQSSQPSPQTPIQPSECGERTGNLFDEIYPNIVKDTPRYKSIYVGNGTFTLSTNTPMFNQSAVLFLLAGNVSGGASTADNGVSVGISRTVTAIDGYVTIAYRWYTGTDPRDYKTMLNAGSTALPYEPYGVKIPILSNSTTTPVYLGEVESTRKVKKLVLTGEENWSGTSKFRIGLSGQIGTIAPICTHYRGVTTASYADLADGRVTVNGGIGLTLAIYDTANQSSLTAWKLYLADQYANGTPVIVWYVLAEPTTGIVNEPLRKIGTYADEVSGISIPTTAGANTLSIGTTLQPSEVTATYKGWHPVADVHEYENGAWD